MAKSAKITLATHDPAACELIAAFWLPSSALSAKMRLRFGQPTIPSGSRLTRTRSAPAGETGRERCRMERLHVARPIPPVTSLPGYFKLNLSRRRRAPARHRCARTKLFHPTGTLSCGLDQSALPSRDQCKPDRARCLHAKRANESPRAPARQL